MKRKLLSILLILAAVFSIAASPMPSAPHRPAAAPRITVIEPHGQTVQPNYDGLDLRVEIVNTSSDTWTSNYYIARETGSAAGVTTPLTFGKDLAPGESMILAADITVPSTIGNYKEIWILCTDTGYVLDRFTWGFMVDGNALEAGDHAEFSSISLATDPNPNFAVNLNETDIDLVVTIKNVGPGDWPLGSYMERESGSTNVTRGITYQALGTVVAQGQTITRRLDLSGMDHSGSETATWIIRTASTNTIVGRFSFTIKTTNDSWINPATHSYAEWTLKSPAAGQTALINTSDPDFIVELKNTGNNTWTTGFYLVRKNGDILAKKGDVQFFLPVSVDPRYSTTIIIDLKAPSTPGTYSTIYYFEDASGTVISEIPMTLKVVNP
jgi:YD repeat-containing protein